MIPKYQKIILNNDKNYQLLEDVVYYCKHYDKYVVIRKGYISDGATGAIDIPSLGWWVHDKMCDTGSWADGTPCSNFQASYVLSEILRKEKRIFRSMYWFAATWLFGGGKCRKNGMW